MNRKNSNPNYLSPPKRGFGLYYDSLYGYIPLPPIIRRAIDLPSMQRLRRVQQLSTVYLVFPGATHSRFIHSVGVFYLADKVFDVLFYKKELFKRDWPEFLPVHRIALQLAALFHDIGHGPWSHVFELFCDTRDDYRELEHRKLTEIWISKGFGNYKDVPSFITTEQKRAEKEWKKDVKKEFWPELEEKMDILTPKNIAKIAVGKPPSDEKYTFLSNIVSGIFDVDRMDYLRRDALYTGVETGNVDIWEIIHGYELAEENGKWIAVLDPRTSTAVEILLTVRDLTYRQVYYHPLNRCIEEMLIRAMYELVDGHSLDELATMDDGEILKVFREANSSFTKDLAQRIRERAIYELLPFSVRISEDLDAGAQSKWGEVAFGLPEIRGRTITKWIQFEKKLSEKLKLPVQHKIIFAYRPVPITQTAEYEVPLFYDDVAKKSFSLLEVLPHLGLTRGTKEIPYGAQKIKIDITAQYIREITDILIAVPFEFIADILKQCEKDIKKGKDTNDVIDSYVTKLRETILDEFIKFIELKDNRKIEKLNNKFEEKIKGYLKECGRFS